MKTASNESKTMDMPPCHDAETHGTKSGSQSENQNKDSTLMFFKDCTGVDLAQTDHNRSLQKPDLQIDDLVFAFVDIAPHHGFSPVSAHKIRGPPFDTSPPPHLENHDLYLTTQRLRL